MGHISVGVSEGDVPPSDDENFWNIIEPFGKHSFGTKTSKK